MNAIRFAGALLVLAVAPATAANFTVHATSSGTSYGQSFTFDPAQLTIQAGDTVTWVNNDNMAHNVVADDGSFRCANGCDGEGSNGNVATGWSFTKTFSDPGTIPYYCQSHGGPNGFGMAGTITVEAAEPPPEPEFAINFGVTGSWADPEKPEARQGFSLEVVPVEGPDLLNAYWFNYAKGEPGGVGKERWFNALGEIQGNQAVMNTIQCTGGVFDSTTAADCPVVGTTTATFTSCTEGTISYELDLAGGPAAETTGEFPITRVTPDVLCEELAAEAAQ